MYFRKKLEPSFHSPPVKIPCKPIGREASGTGFPHWKIAAVLSCHQPFCHFPRPQELCPSVRNMCTRMAKKELTHPSNPIMQKRHFGPRWKGRPWLFAFLQKTFNCQPRAPIMCALAVEVTLFQIQNYSQFCGQDSQEKVPEEAVIQPIGSFASYVSKSHSKISPDSLKAIHWVCEGCECKVYLELLCLCISWVLVADEKASAAERPRM